MEYSKVETGQLVKYMSRTVLVLDDKKDQDFFDGFVYAVEVGETIPGMYNISALETLPPREENG